MRKGLKLINYISDAHSEPGERPRRINLFTYPYQALLITEVGAQVMEAERLDILHLYPQFIVFFLYPIT